jgi:hypothetical protein
VTPGRALLLENIHSDAAWNLKDAGWDVERLDRALGEDELADRLQGVALLGVRSNTTVPARVLERAPGLLAIGAFCIGTNQIDLTTAAERGVAVFNAPFSNTRSVVELALSEIIALTRRLTVKDRDMHAGRWDKSAVGSHEVRGRRLGIVGYGNIGSQLSVLAEALGMSVLFYDSADKLALGNARRCGTLDELLAESDVVTLHVDGRVSNSSLFGEEQFTRMRAGASSSTCPAASSSTTPRCAPTSSRATSPVLPSTSSRSSRSAPARSSCRSCGACRTSSSRPTSAAPPRRRSRTSGTSCRQAARLRRDGTTSLSVNLPPVALPRTAATGCCTCTSTPRRAGDRQLDPRPARHQHRGPAAGDPRVAGLRRHRRRRQRARGAARRPAGHAGDRAPARAGVTALPLDELRAAVGTSTSSSTPT